MPLISIKEYMKREPNTVPFSSFENDGTEFHQALIKTFETDNNIENTGKSCVLMNSENLDLIL